MHSRVTYKLSINSNEAANGTRKWLARKGKRLEVTIPAGVKNGTVMKLSGALQITDGYNGDILLKIRVRKRLRLGVISAVIVGIAITCFLVVTSFLPTEDTSRYIYTQEFLEVGGDNEPIELINNPDAINPTYAQLTAFLLEDTTDDNAYIEYGLKAYVCADFAEGLHNNAEVAGIKAAWVGIDIEDNEEGHALNAFETTDKGLVYIDCMLDDTVAYIEEGKPYGTISIDKVESLQYSFYEKYRQKIQEFETRLEAFNSEVEQYNQEISGKTYIIGSTESARIAAWKDRLEEEEQALDRLVEELGDNIFEHIGIVEYIYIHW